MEGKRFVGGDEHIFPVCFVNPFKKDELKIEIDKYVDLKLIEYSNLNSRAKMLDDSFTERNKGFLKFYFYDRLSKKTEFDIIAIKKECKFCYVLIEAIDKKKFKCVVKFDQKFQNVTFIYF